MKSGFETCLDTYEADPAIIEKNSVYDPDDYSPVFLQVHPLSIQICGRTGFPTLEKKSVSQNEPQND